MFIDINKYVSNTNTNTNNTPDKIVSTQCDFNLIEIYFTKVVKKLLKISCLFRK